MPSAERVAQISRVLRTGRVIPSVTGSMNQPRPPITAHALDTTRGTPAHGLPLTLERLNNDQWELLGSTTTNEDGRAPDLMEQNSAIVVGTYRVRFDTGTYYRLIGEAFFYPEVTIVFCIKDTSQHYHVPLLLSPFGYTTYRGS